MFTALTRIQLKIVVINKITTLIFYLIPENYHNIVDCKIYIQYG